uniref:Uncharacterized protein n=1 Tax=Arundo donax TaxID=35708 RepID=A0A0A9EM79_ARUDO
MKKEREQGYSRIITEFQAARPNLFPRCQDHTNTKWKQCQYATISNNLWSFLGPVENHRARNAALLAEFQNVQKKKKGQVALQGYQSLLSFIDIEVLQLHYIQVPVSCAA